MPESGDMLVNEGGELYFFQKIEDEKVYLTAGAVDGPERVYTVKGNPLWVIPPDSLEECQGLVAEVASARQGLSAFLNQLEKL